MSDQSRKEPARPSAIPIIDTPPEAVDKIYAQSLFELAEAEGGRPLLETIADEFEQLSDLRARDPQTAEFFRSRLISPADKARVLGSAFKDRVSPLLLRFVLYVTRKERLDRIWRIAASFDQLIQERLGRVEVDVFTRFPLSPEELSGIAERLHKALGREPIVHAYPNEGMIGGMKVRVGDKLIDASIETQLRRMRDRLIEQGGAAVRAQFDRIVEEKP